MPAGVIMRAINSLRLLFSPGQALLCASHACSCVRILQVAVTCEVGICTFFSCFAAFEIPPVLVGWACLVILWKLMLMARIPGPHRDPEWDGKCRSDYIRTFLVLHMSNPGCLADGSQQKDSKQPHRRDVTVNPIAAKHRCQFFFAIPVNLSSLELHGSRC